MMIEWLEEGQLSRTMASLGEWHQNVGQQQHWWSAGEEGNGREGEEGEEGGGGRERGMEGRGGGEEKSRAKYTIFKALLFIVPNLIVITQTHP